MTGRTLPSRAGPTRELGNAKCPDTPMFSGVLRLLAEKLESLKTAHPFPVGHGGVERGHLDAGVVEVMLDDVVAERCTGDLGLGEQRGGLRQRGRQAVRATGICIALQRLWKIELLLDAVQ